MIEQVSLVCSHKAGIALLEEIHSQIMACLPKSTMKKARLVCKKWDRLTVLFLYDVIFISPQRINSDIFAAISQHPVYSKCVKRLIYDFALFQGCTTFEVYKTELRTRLSAREQQELDDNENEDVIQVGFVRHQALAEEYWTLLRKAEDLAYLCMALPALTKLKGVILNLSCYENLRDDRQALLQDHGPFGRS